jgi:hypothetical protein
MRQRSKDPLTAATTSILLPALRPLNFGRKTNRLILRISDDILQFIDLQLSSFGDKSFCVNYASIPLFSPRDYLVLQPGDRLRKKGAEAWWSSSDQKVAGHSMTEIVNLLKEQAIPFFNKTETVSGLLKVLLAANWAAKHHLEFERACCRASLHEFDEARRHLNLAIDLYKADGRAWCAKKIDEAKQLLKAIEDHKSSECLQNWRRYSMTKLQLEKFG